MGQLCHSAEPQEDLDIYRSDRNFHVSHFHKLAILKSLFETKCNTQEHGVFTKILKKIDFTTSLTHKLETIYQHILDGTIQLTNQEPLSYFEAKCYLILFHIQFGADDPRYQNYKENIIQFQNTDNHWLQLFIDEYLHLFRKAPQYISWTSQKEQLDFSVYKMPTAAKVLLFGDWGTGLRQASVLMSYAKQYNPTFAIHLGDVYYSGTRKEQELYFISPLKQHLDCTVFSLPGNHDYYSGGEGYMWALTQLGQKASYICLENEFFCLIGMDTAHRYFQLKDEEIFHKMAMLSDDELVWVLDKAKKAFSTNRKLILISHHQLFSFCETFKREHENVILSYNEKLYQQLAEIIPKITCWYWAHEHNFVIFKSYRGLARARLIGNGSCPQHDSDLANMYVPSSSKYTDPKDLPQMEDGNWQSGTNG